MKLVVDLTIVNNPKKITGIERVALQTLLSISRVFEKSKLDEIVILSSKNGEKIIKDYVKSEMNKSIKIYSSPINNRVFTDQLWMPIILKKISPDYVYYTTLGIPIINFFPFSIIIHDAVAWSKPETISRGMRYYYKPIIKKTISNKHLDKIVTVSNFSKKEIIKYLNPQKDIFVNYLGVTNTFKNISGNFNDFRGVLQRYNIDDNYIVAIGTIEPRKNLQGLINAFVILKSKYKYKGKLVIVGRKGWSNHFSIESNVMEDIILTGFVNDEDLPILLKLSDAFVFPSFYEGFGLPLLEAMAMGVPVASSNKASLPEIGGEACVYFNPEDPEEIAEVVNGLLVNPELRKKKSILGEERAKTFTWEKHAENLLSFFRRVKNEDRKYI